MGYTLRIGEGAGLKVPGMLLDMAEIELSEAPPVGMNHYRCNTRMPGYCAWNDFADETGLTDFLFDKRKGVIPDADRGIVRLTPAHLATIKKARRAYKGGGENADRLQWLEWWIAWALEHCQEPSLYRS